MVFECFKPSELAKYFLNILRLLIKLLKDGFAIVCIIIRCFHYTSYRKLSTEVHTSLCDNNTSLTNTLVDEGHYDGRTDYVVSTASNFETRLVKAMSQV